MPYIKSGHRKELDKSINDIVQSIKEQIQFDNEDDLDGILNYCFFRICKSLYPEKYHWYNRMMGMMECCKLELYRRLVAPYEDKKIIENGDVINDEG